MRKVAVVAILVVVVLVGVVVGFFVWATKTEFTECYSVFRSRGAAERAASAVREAGFDASVDHRADVSAMTAESGKTGPEAREFRATFGTIVRRGGGRLGHPGDGCVERTPFI